MKAKYDKIGVSYTTQRKSDPIITEQFHAKLNGAKRILNIGAGTGSYEPQDIDLIALEPSHEMIAQRKPGSHPVVQGFAEVLPFDHKQFSHTISILSMHHWKDRVKAYSEINRVTQEQFVTITWNPNSEAFWLTRDYFPQIYETDVKIFPTLEELQDHFEHIEVSPLWIPYDCHDGFLAAYWKRPEAYLKEKVRNSISTFSTLENLSEGLTQLENDLNSGKWREKNCDVLDLDLFDAGYVIVTAQIK
ncbi:MAG: class I SAM-dependent methyltransferase [Bacteroidota bacterium]